MSQEEYTDAVLAFSLIWQMLTPEQQQRLEHERVRVDRLMVWVGQVLEK